VATILAMTVPADFDTVSTITLSLHGPAATPEKWTVPAGNC
jgi:hypothetical protein